MNINIYCDLTDLKLILEPMIVNCLVEGIYSPVRIVIDEKFLDFKGDSFYQLIPTNLVFQDTCEKLKILVCERMGLCTKYIHKIMYIFQKLKNLKINSISSIKFSIISFLNNRIPSLLINDNANFEQELCALYKACRNKIKEEYAYYFDKHIKHTHTIKRECGDTVDVNFQKSFLYVIKQMFICSNWKKYIGEYDVFLENCHGATVKVSKKVNESYLAVMEHITKLYYPLLSSMYSQCQILLKFVPEINNDFEILKVLRLMSKQWHNTISVESKFADRFKKISENKDSIFKIYMKISCKIDWNYMRKFPGDLKILHVLDSIFKNKFHRICHNSYFWGLLYELSHNVKTNMNCLRKCKRCDSLMTRVSLGVSVCLNGNCVRNSYKDITEFDFVEIVYKNFKSIFSELEKGHTIAYKTLDIVFCSKVKQSIVLDKERELILKSFKKIFLHRIYFKKCLSSIKEELLRREFNRAYKQGLSLNNFNKHYIVEQLYDVFYDILDYKLGKLKKIDYSIPESVFEYFDKHINYKFLEETCNEYELPFFWNKNDIDKYEWNCELDNLCKSCYFSSFDQIKNKLSIVPIDHMVRYFQNDFERLDNFDISFFKPRIFYDEIAKHNNGIPYFVMDLYVKYKDQNGWERDTSDEDD